MLNELTTRSALVLPRVVERLLNLRIEFLKQRGIVVYLYTPVELQLQRTYRDKTVHLQVENPEQKLRDLLTARDPLYREVTSYY